MFNYVENRFKGTWSLFLKVMKTRCFTLLQSARHGKGPDLPGAQLNSKREPREQLAGLIGVGRRPSPLERAGRRQPHQLRIAGGLGAIGSVEIVLESNPGVSASTQGTVHTGQLPLPEGAQKPGLLEGADFQQPIQVGGYGHLIWRITPQHKEDAGI